MSISIKVAVFGSKKSGKTSFIKSFIYGSINDQTQLQSNIENPFIDVFSFVNNKEVQFSFLEINDRFYGLDTTKNDIYKYLQSCLYGFIILDLTNSFSLSTIEQYMRIINANIQIKSEILVIGNKSDLFSKVITQDDVSLLLDKYRFTYIETSFKDKNIYNDAKFQDFLRRNVERAECFLAHLDFPLKMKLCEIDINTYQSTYKVREKIGNGAFGDVLRAENIKLHQNVAIKVISSDHLSHSDLSIYQKEVSILCHLNHNIFIANILGFTSQNPFSIILEYVPNGNLFNCIHQSSIVSSLDDTRKTIIAMGIAYGMAHIHDMKIIHRDLKSLNVLLDKNFYPIICDFGVSVFDEGVNAAANFTVGTVQWMAPEMLENQKYTNKIDVYSYSMILIELLTKTVPFSKESKSDLLIKVLNRNERPRLALNTPKPLEKLIKECWDRDPVKRPDFHSIFERFALHLVEFEKTDRNEINNFLNYIKMKYPNDQYLSKLGSNLNTSSQSKVTSPNQSSKIQIEQCSIFNLFSSNVFNKKDSNPAPDLTKNTVNSNNGFYSNQNDSKMMKKSDEVIRKEVKNDFTIQNNSSVRNQNNNSAVMSENVSIKKPFDQINSQNDNDAMVRRPLDQINSQNNSIEINNNDSMIRRPFGDVKSQNNSTEINNNDAMVKRTFDQINSQNNSTEINNNDSMIRRPFGDVKSQNDFNGNDNEIKSEPNTQSLFEKLKIEKRNSQNSITGFKFDLKPEINDQNQFEELKNLKNPNYQTKLSEICANLNLNSVSNFYSTVIYVLDEFKKNKSETEIENFNMKKILIQISEVIKRTFLTSSELLEHLPFEFPSLIDDSINVVKDSIEIDNNCITEKFVSIFKPVFESFPQKVIPVYLTYIKYFDYIKNPWLFVDLALLSCSFIIDYIQKNENEKVDFYVSQNYIYIFHYLCKNYQIYRNARCCNCTKYIMRMLPFMAKKGAFAAYSFLTTFYQSNFYFMSDQSQGQIQGQNSLIEIDYNSIICHLSNMNADQTAGFAAISFLKFIDRIICDDVKMNNLCQILFQLAKMSKDSTFILIRKIANTKNGYNMLIKNQIFYQNPNPTYSDTFCLFAELCRQNYIQFHNQWSEENKIGYIFKDSIPILFTNFVLNETESALQMMSSFLSTRVKNTQQSAGNSEPIYLLNAYLVTSFEQKGFFLTLLQKCESGNFGPSLVKNVFIIVKELSSYVFVPSFNSFVDVLVQRILLKDELLSLSLNVLAQLIYKYKECVNQLRTHSLSFLSNEENNDGNAEIRKFILSIVNSQQ